MTLISWEGRPDGPGVGNGATDGAGGRLTKSSKAVTVAAAASTACQHNEPMSWSMGRVLGDSPAVLTPGDGRSPIPTEISVCDARRSDLPEDMAGNRPTTRDRRSMDAINGRGGEAVRLPAVGAGNRRVDCDAGRGASGGPITLRDGDGDTQQGAGIIDGKSGSNM